MTTIVHEKKNILVECKTKAQKISKELMKEDVNKQLNAICMIEKIPNISGDEELREMNDYSDVKTTLKQLYIDTARTIMNILGKESGFVNDQDHSFNYEEAKEPLLAAEYIKLLPNAYISGPMKSAINHTSTKVKKIAIDHYDSLPSEIKYSEVFAHDFRQIIRSIKAKKKIAWK